MSKENIDKEKQGIITKLIYHSLEIKLSKQVVRKSKELKDLYDKVFYTNKQHKLVAIQEVITELQSKINRHLEIAAILSKKLLTLNEITTEIDADSIVPFKLKDIERGYIKISSPANSTVEENDCYYIILSTADVLHEDSEELEMLLRESYSQLPKGYALLLLN
jgi:hypothetical protein